MIDSDGAMRVTVLPITHSPPEDRSAGVEIPAETKKRLGLDAERSYGRGRTYAPFRGTTSPAWHTVYYLRACWPSCAIDFLLFRAYGRPSV